MSATNDDAAPEETPTAAGEASMAVGGTAVTGATDERSEDAAAENAQPSRTMLLCLTAVARHHGVDLSPERLVHDYALGSAEPSEALVIRMVRDAGLKARVALYRWQDLARLGLAFPVIARLDNGNTVVLIGAQVRDGVQQVAVRDPLAPAAGTLWLDEAKFTKRWSGWTLLLKRAHRLTDENQPFGLRWFIPEILRQRSLFRDVLVAALALHGLALVVPMFVQLVIDRVLTHQTYGTLYVLSAGVCIAILFEAAFGFMRQYVLLYACNRIDIRVAVRTFAHLLSLPAPFFDHSAAGVLVQHMQQGERVRQFLTGRLFLTVVDASALFVFIPMLLLYSVPLSLLVIGGAALIALVILSLIGPFRRRLKALYEAQGQRQALLVETIHGIQTVKAMALEPRRRRTWDERTARTVETHFRVGTISAGAQTVTGTLDKLITVGIVAFGTQLVFDGTLSVGALIAFQMIAARVSQPLVAIVGLIHEYQEVAIAVSMLGRVMNERPEGALGSRRLTVPLQGALEFDRVSFRYTEAGPPALDQVSFQIPAGGVLGIVGRSGSGKTTVTRMIQGIYTPQTGNVRIDRHDVRELDLAHLRSSIGVVLQENFIFHGTVRENIGMTRPDARFEEIVEAARMAGAEEFIQNLPQGYDTPLVENGANLSGGQRQRLAIARALLSRPRLLILDEATSALDPESEAIVQRNLARIAAGRTVIMVSHRLSLLVNADRILVLDQGRLIDQGRHGELLARCLTYRHLWAQQNRHSAA